MSNDPYTENRSWDILQENKYAIQRLIEDEIHFWLLCPKSIEAPDKGPMGQIKQTHLISLLLKNLVHFFVLLDDKAYWLNWYFVTGLVIFDI